MIFSTVNKIPSFLLEKLDILFQLLKERKAEYEVFAGRVQNKELKRTVLTLAQETNQYAIELSSQIETMSGKNEFDSDVMAKMAGCKPIKESALMISGQDDILKSCEISESRMITAYRHLLNETVLHENLRKLISCQLNSLTYTFLQLRLLNTSLHG